MKHLNGDGSLKEVRNLGSDKIEPLIIRYFYSKMFQLMKSRFVKGETYYVKMKKGSIVGDIIFTHYSSDSKLKTGLWFDHISGRYSYLFELNEINIYKYVSDEEYYAKVKENYDATCLNIILKRLIDETFEW